MHDGNADARRGRTHLVERDTRRRRGGCMRVRERRVGQAHAVWDDGLARVEPMGAT